MKKLSLLTILVSLFFFACTTSKTTTTTKKSMDKTTALGIEWTLESVKAAQSDELLSPGEGKTPTLTFSSDGTSVSGNSGCNRFSGKVTWNENQLTFGNLVSTRMYCVEGMKIETALTSAFKETTEYELSGEKLLLKKGDTILATFAKSK